MPRVEPNWLPVAEILAINRDEIVGGEVHSVWDLDLLHSAAARPLFYWKYHDEDDVVVLACLLCCGIAQDHCFEAANKRTALAAAGEFLEWNGYILSDDGSLGPYLELFVKKLISEAEFTEILRGFVSEV